MTLTARIDADCKCLNRYFQKLFEVLKEAIAEERTAPVEVVDITATDSQATFFGFAHQIKPDMILNIYSLVDFWMKEVCNYQMRKNSLTLSYKDIKGNSDLHTYHKYLASYAGLDLSKGQISYECLDDLRKVRNVQIHNGGHIPSGQEKEFSKISGILLFGSMIVIEESFVWSALDHAKKYLYVAAQA